MKLHARTFAWLLPFMLTACLHKPQPINIRQYLPPPSKVPMPETQAVELPLSEMTIPSQPLDADSQAMPPPKPHARRRRQNKNTQEAVDSAPPTPSVPQPAVNETPAVSAIGQLSSGDSSDTRQQTLNSIAATERGLNGVNRTLSDQEQKTAAHIREFLKQARDALASGDVDGAHTLAAKARVLLSELAGT